MIARLIGTIRESLEAWIRNESLWQMSLVQLDWRSRCRIPKGGAPVDAY
jgi:hypothetical protein